MGKFAGLPLRVLAQYRVREPGEAGGDRGDEGFYAGRNVSLFLLDASFFLFQILYFPMRILHFRRVSLELSIDAFTAGRKILYGSLSSALQPTLRGRMARRTVV